LRRDNSEVVRVAMEINIEGRRGKSKKKWLNRIENAMKTVGVNKGKLQSTVEM